MANAFLGSEPACRQDEFMPLSGRGLNGGQPRPREASAALGLLGFSREKYSVPSLVKVVLLL